MNNDILHEQVAYYRARAQEYDESIFQTGRFAVGQEQEQPAGLGDDLAFAAQTLQTLEPCEEILELACGTGIWTRDLVKIGRSITALDAAPEMLEINARSVADPRVRYQQADLFAWEPEQQYDLVFFGFWLSHVPPEALDSFLAKVQRAVLPGGQLCIVDQYAPFPEERLAAQQGIYHTRTLYDGRAFTIVKIFYDLAMLQEKLARLGFTATMQQPGDYFFCLTGST